jgi:hypothetical protein
VWVLSSVNYALLAVNCEIHVSSSVNYVLLALNCDEIHEIDSRTLILSLVLAFRQKILVGVRDA